MKQEENEFMRHELRLPELTVRGMILGAILTVIFTASNVYLGLKVGLTFSSAIPAAVISMAILKMAKGSNILENNMVQTQASAAGTLSAIIFIIPGMLMIGYWQGFEFWQTLIVSACGGCLGVLFTIPLRRAMVVHSDLAYRHRPVPEALHEEPLPAAARRRHGHLPAARRPDAPLALVGKDFAGTAEYLGLAVFSVSLLIFSKVVLGGSDK